MSRVMYGWKWSDGTWRDGPEFPKQEALPPPKKQWVKRGFFTDTPLPRREVAIKASNARLWLSSLLHKGPVLATKVFAKAKAEGFSKRAIQRAKRRLAIKSRRCGGKGTGRHNPWIWQVSVSK